MENAMSSSRHFRFGVINERMETADAWVRQARETENLGYSTFLVRDHFVPDHFGDQFAPFSALMAAANATKTMRVGSLVIDNDYRHPVVLAKEAATLDLLSGGRFELGLGAGFLKTEYDKAGIMFDPPGVRISRLSEAVAVLTRLFALTDSMGPASPRSPPPLRSISAQGASACSCWQDGKPTRLGFSTLRREPERSSTIRSNAWRRHSHKSSLGSGKARANAFPRSSSA